MHASAYLEEKIFDTIFRGASSAWLPATVYAGIVSDSGTDQQLEEGTLTNEITGYTGDRKAITFDAPVKATWDVATKMNLGAVLEFEDMPAPAGRQAKYWIVCDAPTAGNILLWMPIKENGTPTTKVWNEGDVLRILTDSFVDIN